MRKSSVGALAGIFIFLAFAAAIVFHALFAPGAILQVTDGNIGVVAYNQRVLASSPVSLWLGETLWGLPDISNLHLWALEMQLLSARGFMNLFYGFSLWLSAFLLALYLRDKGLKPAACVFGGLVAFWVGTNLTLVSAGHIGKFGVLVFLSLALFALGRWGDTKKTAWSLVAGMAAGAMFLEQADVALFCALLLVPVGLFEAARAAESWNPLQLLRRSWGAGLAAALIVIGASMSIMGAGVTDVPGEDASDAGWGYLTQWSQPPGESLDFIAPGWTGWRSGDPEGPYWGKMGRSDGWEQTRQGFMNFKLENVYVGAIPFLFAIMALGYAVGRRREERSKVIGLWVGLCLISLFLAFGKFFPLYRPLSWLPGFSSIRNPNKFIHFFQIAWGVLAAFGLDAAFRMERPVLKRWLWMGGILSALFFLSGLALWSDLTAGGVRLSMMGWGEAGKAIQWNKAFSVTYAGAALAVGVGFLWVLMRPQWKEKAWVAWIPALVVVFDAAVILAPHYIQTMPKGGVAENELVRVLKREVGHHRTAMATQDGFYNQWLTYLFPYYGIPSVNITQLPRPPADYTAFWGAVKDPVQLWKLTSVSHVLAHGPVAAQLLSNPSWAAQLEPAWAYQPMDDGQGGIQTRSVAVTPEAPELVLRLKTPTPRVAAALSWLEMADEEALRRMARSDFQPGQTVFLPENSGTMAPPVRPEAASPAVVEISTLTPGRYEFTVDTEAPVLIRVAEKYNPAWKATVDGKAVPVFRCDYMFQGILLEQPGIHQVVLRYAPSSFPLWLEVSGLLIGLAGAVSLLWPRRRKAAV
jgi:hypothetical protein